MALTYKTINTTVEVEVDIDEFDTDELIELVSDLYQKRRTGRDYTSNIDALIYQVIGRI